MYQPCVKERADPSSSSSHQIRGSGTVTGEDILLRLTFEMTSKV